ncbi:uncharacterized protein PADG_06753 [Paracoccidioides brasiliensis Pb18]|uniref:COX assembly mitochondrial protein n=2 Tax=Paracoccidioides brasiliensis TaxID=121759 RepID=C1GHL7_PARBD|nr:uncharacterized protein PADG_06753 [Paracoccidioides brasiliensis Pb18]EEH50674.2 hypothetical protein PADG_06753 [Paracoccidioides brasiliensis Pb18]ODH26958.1 hypothetical protein ACO22_04356 [Paracoccidioides brasiliensis]
MAASTTTSTDTATTTPPTPASQPSPPNVNIRNPLPLSASQEAQVRDLYYKRVRGYCAAEIKDRAHCYSIPSPLALHLKNLPYPKSIHLTKPLRPPEFAACAINRTITATWVCRKQRLAMNACMVEHAKPEVEDRAREEWFAGREERRRARELQRKKTEERQREVMQMTRDEEERRRKATAEGAAANGKGKGWFG